MPYAFTRRRSNLAGAALFCLNRLINSLRSELAAFAEVRPPFDAQLVARLEHDGLILPTQIPGTMVACRPRHWKRPARPACIGRPGKGRVVTNLPALGRRVLERHADEVSTERQAGAGSLAIQPSS